MIKNHYDCIIIGAGIAGLSYAFKLKEQGKDFLIVEKSNSIGGSWQSHEYKSCIYEFGPNTIMNSSNELFEMIQAIGFEDQILSKNLKNSTRYLYLKNKLIEVSTNPFKLFCSDLLSLRAKLRVFLEPFKPKRNHNEETVHDFTRRKFGEEIATNLVASALQGIWAGDTKRLSAKSALSKIYQLEEKYNSLLFALFKNKKKKKSPAMISFKKGMQSFSYALAEYLGFENFLLETNTKISKATNGFELTLIEKNNNTIKLQTPSLIIASKAFEASDLLRPMALRLSDLLNQIYYAPVFLSALSINKKYFSVQQKKLFNAFGFIDSKLDHLHLGTIFASELFEIRKLEDEFLLLSFSGGARNSQILDFTNEDLIETISEEICSILQKHSIVNLNPANFKIINSARVERAIPQYNLGHDNLIKKIQEEKSKYPGLELIGNYIAGVSVPDTIAYAFEKASKCHREEDEVRRRDPGTWIPTSQASPAPLDDG